MPVTTLLVEGELDAQLLHPFFSGQPVVGAAKASKNALAPRTRTERQKGLSGTCYLRDRDFDYLPPEDVSRPTVDKEEDNSILGWRWARHEIENYMLEPAIVASCLGVTIEEFSDVLRTEAKRIRYYEAARWSIGLARAKLLPPVKFQTRPAELVRKEFCLPRDLGESAMSGWATCHANSFLQMSSESLTENVIERVFGEFTSKFSDDFFDGVDNVLLWFSGKDLMATIKEWLAVHNIESPKTFRTRMRDWMMERTSIVLDSLVEWRTLMEVVRE